MRMHMRSQPSPIPGRGWLGSGPVWISQPGPPWTWTARSASVIPSFLRRLVGVDDLNAVGPVDALFEVAEVFGAAGRGLDFLHGDVPVPVLVVDPGLVVDPVFVSIGHFRTSFFIEPLRVRGG